MISDTTTNYSDGEPTPLTVPDIISHFNSNNILFHKVLQHYRDLGHIIGVYLREDDIDRMSCAFDTIWVGSFSDPDLERVAFFHEIGHIQLSLDCKTAGRVYYMSKISTEGAAWEIGLNIMAQHGGGQFKYTHPAMVWARAQLFTYVQSINNGELN